jgi:hypothetical protein
MKGEFKQFKLTNGDEMICELVTTAEDDSTADVIVRRAMKIVVTDDLEENIRYYTLKPWISFQDDTTDLVALNSVHIVGESTPSETVMMHYAAALADVDKYNKVRSAGLTLQEIQDKLKELTEEEMDAFLTQKYNELQGDSDTANVIQFKPKGSYH